MSVRRTILLVLSVLLLGLIGPGVAAASSSGGAVFTLSNAVGGNRVLIWQRAADGSLVAAGSAPTGGLGTGSGLGSQGAVTLSGNHHWLYAVNAGSDEISVFRVGGSHLTLVDVASSGGDMPISVTVRGNTVYVLNAGGVGNIQGFHVDSHGQLSSIAGSIQTLSQAAPGPAEISFSPSGRRLVVTEKATNRLTYYAVSADGTAGLPHWRDSLGMTPFGFAFARNGTIVVSEAAGGAPDASSTSSYRFTHGGALNAVDGPVATTETAACWVALTRNGRYAYVANTGSGTVTGYSISATGDLTRLDVDGVTGSTGAGSAPSDETLDGNSQHLYVRNGGTGSIDMFDVMPDGSLTSLGEVTGLPSGAAGLAAY